MLKILSNTSTLAITAVMASTLVLAGCGNKDNPKNAAGAVKMESLKKRTVSEAEAEKALAAMDLNTSGSGVFKWADRDGSAGNYTYKNVTITGDDGENVTLDMLELKGAHMDGELAAFDAISFGGLSAKNDDDNADVKIAKIELIKPTPALANAFARTFGGDEDAFDNIEGPVGFSGFNLVDAKITSDDGNGALKSMSFGESSDKTGLFSMKGLDFSTTKDANVSMSLGSIEGTGLNIEKYKGFFEEGFKSGKNGDEISEDAMKSIMQSMNMYDPDFRTASIKDFDMNVEGLTVDFDAITAKADSKGGKTTITQSISPVTITPPANPGAEMKEFAEALSTMGYDKMVFSTSQKSVLDESTDSMKVTDSYIELQDGFKLAFDYDLIGYKAMMEKATAMGADGNDDPMAGLEVLSEMKFNDFAISFSDNSIIDRAFKLAASQQGGTPDALKNQAKMGLAFLPMMAQDEAQQKIASDLSAGVGKLLEDGGTLTIKLNPETPIDFAAIMQSVQSGSFDAASLGVSITHK